MKTLWKKFSLLIVLLALSALLLSCTSSQEAQGSGDIYFQNVHAQKYYDANGNLITGSSSSSSTYPAWFILGGP